MTVQERKTLEEVLQSKLEDDMTVRQMKTILTALQDSFAEMDTMAQAADDGRSDDLLQAFIQAKRVTGLSEKTLAKYARTLKRILADEKVSPAHVTVEHLRHWLAKELSRGLSEKTVSGDRDTMCSFFGWLHREGLIPRNPCANLEPIKVPKVIRRPFDSVEIELMKEACGSNARNKAIICFMLASGVRISELIQLNRDDIDFQNKECIVFGKGAKERTVYLDDVAISMLQRYLDTRKDTKPALFPGRGSDRMTDNGVRAMMKRLEAASGVENIHPHRFRRTMATAMSKKGMPVDEIAILLGHEDVRTTMKYICKDKNTVKRHYQALAA